MLSSLMIGRGTGYRQVPSAIHHVPNGRRPAASGFGDSVSPNTTQEEASRLYICFISGALQRPKVRDYYNLGIGSTLTHGLCSGKLLSVYSVQGLETWG